MHPRMAELLFYVGDLEWTGLSGDCDGCGAPVVDQASPLNCALHIMMMMMMIMIMMIFYQTQPARLSGWY